MGICGREKWEETGDAGLSAPQLLQSTAVYLAACEGGKWRLTQVILPSSRLLPAVRCPSSGHSVELNVSLGVSRDVGFRNWSRKGGRSQQGSSERVL